jgi:hypothetical protein
MSLASEEQTSNLFLTGALVFEAGVRRVLMSSRGWPAEGKRREQNHSELPNG